LFSDFAPPQKIAGMYSEDGLRWTRYDQPICDNFADSQYSGFWDEFKRKYVIFGRVAGAGRAIGRSESEDFAHFSPLSLVLQADSNYLPDTDLYNPAAMKYPYAANVYFMFPSVFNHKTQTLEIGLSVSRDGLKWCFPYVNTPFIPLGKDGQFDCGSLYMGQGMLLKGKELWLFYGGSRMNHAQGELENIRKPGNSRTYSRVISRLDGFVSAEATDRKGWFITPKLIFAGNILKLNASGQKGGAIRIGILDPNDVSINGFSVEDCIPITGDDTSVIVRWNKNCDVTSLAGKLIKIKFEMEKADLYAFQFTVGYAGQGRDH
jgi:hypothetical protein